MATPEDIEARVSRLEQEVAQLRGRVAESSDDAAAARVLASGADRDVSEVRAELRAHSRVLNALRESQRELAEAQREMHETLLLQGERITSLEGEMRGGFAEIHTGMAQIVTLLGGPPPTA